MTVAKEVLVLRLDNQSGGITARHRHVCCPTHRAAIIAGTGSASTPRTIWMGGTTGLVIAEVMARVTGRIWSRRKNSVIKAAPILVATLPSQNRNMLNMGRGRAIKSAMMATRTGSIAAKRANTRTVPHITGTLPRRSGYRCETGELTGNSRRRHQPRCRRLKSRCRCSAPLSALSSCCRCLRSTGQVPRTAKPLEGSAPVGSSPGAD